MRDASKHVMALLLVVTGSLSAELAHAQSTIRWEDLGCAVKCAEWKEVDSICSGRCLEWDPETRRCLEREPPYPCKKKVCVREERASDTCSSGTLSRNDRFEISVQPNAVPGDTIEFRLTTDWNITWWKQLTIGEGSWHIWNQDHQSWCDWPDPVTIGCTSMPEWSSVMLAPNGVLTFSKAGFLGAHEDVYRLRDLGRWLKPGDRVNFRWVQD